VSFQALYRKYRSQTFGELVGQEPVATALRHAVRDDRVGHAYLFVGPRGTGKTSTARILAKAVNCARPTPEGEPCNECESCAAIAHGSSMDVLELDAASNNGVNEMRELLGRVAYRSAGGRWKVYIIDEVHMLSAAASNALLKTLEEPPEHVKFVLATTDPHKVLPTIRSRTQQFEFGLLPTDKLAAHLAAVAAAEGVAAEPEALQLMARRAAGSARDALSLLDQAIAHGDGRVETAAVRGLFEATAFDRQAAVLDAIAAEDAAAALARLEEVMATGVDARALADELLRYLRDVYVLAASKGAVRVDRLAEEQARQRAQGEELGAGTVQRAIETLGAAVADMTRAPDARLVLEVAVVRLARRELGTQVEVLLDRVERLERTVEELRRGGLALPPAAAPSVAAASPPGPGVPPEPEPPATAGREEPSPAPRPAGAARPTIGALRRADATRAPGGAAAPAGAPAPAAPAPAPPSASTAPASPAPAPAPPLASPAPAPAPPLASPAPAPVAPDPAPAVPAPAPPPGPVPADDPVPSVDSAPPAAQEPGADPGVATEGAGADGVDLDTVVLRWPEVLDRLGGGRVRLAVNEMHPVRLEGATVVVALSSASQRHLPVLEGAQDVVAEALRDVLGVGLGVRAEISDVFVPRQPAGESRAVRPARPPRPTRGAVVEEPPPPPDPGPDFDDPDVVDPDELVDAPPAGAATVDSVARMIQLFDATVVDEAP
jgi:DNA polymerase-3 subunit gamma/tau